MLAVVYDEKYGVCQPDGLIPAWICQYFYNHHDEIMSTGFKLILNVSQYQFIDDLILFLNEVPEYYAHTKFFYHERECYKLKRNWNKHDFLPFKFRDELDKAKYRYGMMPDKITTYACNVRKTYVEETGRYLYELILSS